MRLCQVCSPCRTGKGLAPQPTHLPHPRTPSCLAPARRARLVWPLYWLAQGTMFWALFVVGHDW